MRKIFAEGKNAYKAGCAIQDCPYTQNAEHKQEWRSGWSAGRAEADKKRQAGVVGAVARCGDCRWWMRRADEPGQGECRGGPPTASAENSNGIFPLTKLTDWCAKFRPLYGQRGRDKVEFAFPGE